MADPLFDRDALDVEDLTPEAARAYLVDRITYQKKLERQVEDLRQQVETWARRVALAEERGAPDLAAQARARHQELATRLDELALEADTEKVTNDLLRQRVERLVAFQPSVDAEALATQFDLAFGEEARRAQVDDALRQISVEEELETLKRKLRAEGDEGEPRA